MPAVNLPFFGRTGSVCMPKLDPVNPYLGQGQPAFYRSSIASLWISGEANDYITKALWSNAARWCCELASWVSWDTSHTNHAYLHPPMMSLKAAQSQFSEFGAISGHWAPSRKTYRSSLTLLRAFALCAAEHLRPRWSSRGPRPLDAELRWWRVRND